LETVRRQFELAFASSPITGAVLRCYSSSYFASFLLLAANWFFRSIHRFAKRKESAIRMEHRQIALEVVDKIKFHFCQF
jgi:hypothetical protein